MADSTRSGIAENARFRSSDFAKQRQIVSGMLPSPQAAGLGH